VPLAVAVPRAQPRDRWLELQSPHFVVVSNAGEEKARQVSEEFERVRSVLHALTRAGIEDARQPVVVLAVAHEDNLRELLPQFWERKGTRPVAAYWTGPHQHYIALRVDASELEWRRRVVHEFIHLLANVNFRDAPAWLDEGLSEFWSTVVVDDDGIEVGRPALHHVRRLRSRRAWIPLEELLAMERAPETRDGRRLAAFYAQSWALTHYVMLGRARTVVELEPARYIEHLREGADAVTAASLAFGDLQELEQTVSAYVRTGRFRALRLEAGSTAKGTEQGPGRHEAERTVRVRPLSAAESLALRAQAVVDGQRAATALPLLTEAVRLDPGETAALETLGSFYFQQNKPDEAARWFDRAIETGSASYFAHFYRAILARPADGLVPSAEDLLRRAIELNPAFAPAYARLADLYARDASRLRDALPLARRAAELEPENPAHWVHLGKLLLRLNRPREAREVGERGLAAARSASVREAVETSRSSF
jgi:tetratricopeptide (TPR) repeat protein